MLRNGKPLKDYKQGSDMTGFTKPVISPSPHISVCFDSESHETRMIISSTNSCCLVSTDCSFVHPLSTLDCIAPAAPNFQIQLLPFSCADTIMIISSDLRKLYSTKSVES